MTTGPVDAADTREVLVGRVGRPHGVRGELSVEVRTDEPERRFAPGVRLRTARGPLTVEAARWHRTRLLVRVAGVADRAAAESLRGLDLALDVPAGESPADPDEYYDHQLVGLTVLDRSGERLGEVEAVLHLQSDDLLVVRGPQGGLHLPFRAEVVSAVDLASHRLLVDADSLRDGIPSGDQGG
ncbi:MAG TPA: ribosome maturation factor RimM [Nocardioidaceae bacterium]|nr:ribosome maturation factor RimM [Nocardioidaceae bacterium]